MNKTDNECKRCLLYELADKAQYKNVRAYIDSMPIEERAEEEVYQNRLAVCRECDFLISAMCRKCGCYVEVRAAVKTSQCPNVPHKW